MKYRDLIQFDPIESVIVLRSADDRKKAEELVSSYVMSDNMAELISAKILSQLQLEKVVDNKGILLVGNYGTGKSHLMSVVSAVAGDAEMLALAQNEQFRQDAACIAGKFEVLRIEIGSTTMSLRNIIISNIEQDLKKRGISYKFPDVSTITNNKDALMDMMAAFAEALLGKNARAAIDKFLQSGHLPIPVDQQFIDSVNSMLSGLESLEVHMDKLQAVMTSWGPCTPEDFKQNLAQWVDNQTSGKDKSKVRIVIK